MRGESLHYGVVHRRAGGRGAGGVRAVTCRKYSLVRDILLFNLETHTLAILQISVVLVLCCKI